MIKSKAINPITRAQNSLVYSLKIELIASLILDSNCDINHEYKLDEWFDILTEKGNLFSNYIQRVVSHFHQTFVRAEFDAESWTKLQRECPTTAVVLHKWGFGNSLINKNGTIITNSEKYYISPGDMGYSFWSNYIPFIYLLKKYLLRENKKLIIYSLPENASTFYELPYLMGQIDKNIEVRDLVSYRFSSNDLKECLLSGGSLTMTKDICNALYKNLNIESSYVDSTTRRESKYIYPGETDLNLLKHASRILCKKLLETKQMKLQHHIIDEIIKEERPIACIINRDDAYVGGGQPWRDSDIENYNESIKYLIDKGYSVVRLNLVAHRSSYTSKYFWDFSAMTDINQIIQLKIMLHCKLIVGTLTGLTGLSQIISSAPALMVDGAVLKPHHPWNYVMDRPKNIIPIKAKDVTFEDIQSMIFNPNPEYLWDNQTCNTIGVKLRELSSQEILNATKDFLECVENNQWKNKNTLYDLGANKNNTHNVILTDEASKMLKELLYISRQ